MDDINGEQTEVKNENIENEKDENKNITEKINKENNIKEITQKKQKQNEELESIINKDPLEELKLIKEKINNENKKIKQINSQLEKITVSNSRSIKKRNKEFKDDYESYSNNKKNKSNNLLSPNINVSSSQQIINSNSLRLDPSLNLIYQKIENLRKIKIVKINSDNKNIEEENYLSEKRNNSNIKTNIDNTNKLNLRILALEEEVKKDKEEKQKNMKIK